MRRAVAAWVFVLAGAWVAPCVLLAQDAPAGSSAPQPIAMAKGADPDWEVASVRPTDPNDPNGQRVRLSGRHVMLLNTTAEQFLLLGYGVQKSQLAGEPDWVKTERWNVDGVPDAEGEPSWAQLQGMMRKILAERFGMKLHKEQREMPVFALAVAKGGPKMTPNASDPDGWMNQQNESANGQHTEAIENGSMADLVTVLQFRMDRPVVDQTGLNGRYDFKLQWMVDEARATDANAAPGLFTAIQEQLGLKLEPVKAPADVLVIDKVERPGAN